MERARGKLVVQGNRQRLSLSVGGDTSQLRVASARIDHLETERLHHLHDVAATEASKPG